MAFAVVTKLKNAKRVLDYLHEHDLLDRRFQFKKTENEIAFPSTTIVKIANSTCETVDDNYFASTTKPKTLRDLLSAVLSTEQLEKLKTAYDQVGTIAILEIDDELRDREIEIANALLQTNPSICTVLRKDGSHSGPYRTQRMKFLAGIDTRETTHIENGVRMRIDVEQVYFSPRLSTERERIAKHVKPDENVMVFFSGAAPYCAIIAKKTAAKIIVAIEINPIAHKFAQETIQLNKLKNVHLFCGDVHKILPLLSDKKQFAHLAQVLPRTYNRIIMNLPKSAHEFLDDALSISKSGTIIHYYDFLHEDEFDTAVERIDAACKKHSLNYAIQGIHTCGAQGVRTYRICVDVKII